MNVQTRLTRSAHNKVIGGVAGGMAEYFGIDPVIVRVIFVAMVFAGGMSILLYPILWLIMPLSTSGQASIAGGFQEMQQAGQSVVGQFGEGAQALRTRVEAAFANNQSAQPRFDPQTGQPVAQPARSNRMLGMALLAVGTLMIASMIPGLGNVALPLMLLGGGFYLLRRNS